ncbi:MAG: hypothetical protein IJ217_02290 [Clostridia bacterium]|nr:hypothetical protein [Clostridia bacterium]
MDSNCQCDLPVITKYELRGYELYFNKLRTRSGREALVRNELPEGFPESIPFKEINPARINVLRKNGKPGALLKRKGKYFYAELPGKKVEISNSVHRCHDCEFLCAASDENGGCQKVRDLKKRLEKYDDVTFGIETFNVDNELSQCIVFKCTKYDGFYNKPELTLAEKEKQLRSLAGVAAP